MVLLEDCELPLSSRFGTINRCRLPVCGLIRARAVRAVFNRGDGNARWTLSAAKRSLPVDEPRGINEQGKPASFRRT
jgi:hypothetical protein